MLKQSINSGGFFAVNFACRFLLTIALGKSLSLGDYGTYVLISTVVSMATLLLPLDASQYYMREVPGRPRGEGATLFKSVVVPQTLIFSGLAAIAVLVPGMRQWVAVQIGVPERGWVVLVISGILVTESLANDLVRYLYARRQIERGNEVLFLQGSIWGLVTFGVFAFDRKALTLPLLISVWLGSLCMAVTYGLWRSDLGVLRQAPVQLGVYVRALRFGLPLLTARLGHVMDWIARFLLVSIYSQEVVGAYAYYYGIIMMIAAISSPIISGPIEPYAIAAYNAGQQARSGHLLSVALRYRVLLILPPLVLVVVLDHTVISILARAEYAKAGALMVLLAPVPILNVLIASFERVLYLGRRTLTISRCYVYASALQLGLYVLFVPFHPYYGAAVAKTVGSSALAGLFWHQTRSAPVHINLTLGRVAVAGVACLPIAWAAGWATADVSSVGRLLIAGGAIGVAYATALWLLRAIPPNERRVFRDLVQRASRRALVLLGW